MKFNPRPLPRPESFRWASPMLWNGEVRNYGQAIASQILPAMVTDEARENIRAAMVMEFNGHE